MDNDTNGLSQKAINQAAAAIIAVAQAMANDRSVPWQKRDLAIARSHLSAAQQHVADALSVLHTL